MKYILEYTDKRGKQFLPLDEYDIAFRFGKIVANTFKCIAKIYCCEKTNNVIINKNNHNLQYVCDTYKNGWYQLGAIYNKLKQEFIGYQNYYKCREIFRIKLDVN